MANIESLCNFSEDTFCSYITSENDGVRFCYSNLYDASTMNSTYANGIEANGVCKCWRVHGMVGDDCAEVGVETYLRLISKLVAITMYSFALIQSSRFMLYLHSIQAFHMNSTCLTVMLSFIFSFFSVLSQLIYYTALTVNSYNLQHAHFVVTIVASSFLIPAVTCFQVSLNDITTNIQGINMLTRSRLKTIRTANIVTALIFCNVCLLYAALRALPLLFILLTNHFFWMNINIADMIMSYKVIVHYFKHDEKIVLDLKRLIFRVGFWANICGVAVGCNYLGVGVYYEGVWMSLLAELAYAVYPISVCLVMLEYCRYLRQQFLLRIVPACTIDQIESSLHKTTGAATRLTNANDIR